jgi:hypothetical protein
MFNSFKRAVQNFILTFAIIPPSPEQELRATFFICMTFLGSLLMVIGLGLVVLR